MDRPASGRVLRKADFAYRGEADDEHDGAPIRVHSWEIVSQHRPLSRRWLSKVAGRIGESARRRP